MNVERTTLAVVICTYRRPQVLAGLLRRLVDAARRVEDIAGVGVVVVDDDPEGSAADAAAAVADDFELGVRYVRTGSGNISTARNAAVEAGSAMGDLLAMTDDDCLPEVDWLEQLLEVRRRTDADIVCGACVDVAPIGAPRWVTEQPFLDGISTGVDGAPTLEGHVKNLLVDASFIHQHGILFDEALGTVGGEDAAFIHAVDLAGADRRFARHAIVSEQLPSSRVTLRYQLRRRFWYGNTEAVTSIANGRTSRPRMLLSGAKQVVVGVSRPLLRLLRRERPEWRYGCSEVLRGVGRVLGALGVAVEHR